MKRIRSALVSVFYKDGLDPLVRELAASGVTLYSTGGTQQFIEKLGLSCIPVEEITSYPSILGGRVKTLHPSVFGGILGRRYNENDIREMKDFQIPEIDLVIVDLYPFEQTLATVNADEGLSEEEKEPLIIEKIDIGGPSMIRAAAKNFRDITVIASKDDYQTLVDIIRTQYCQTDLQQRKQFAAKAFDIVTRYDVAITKYFNPEADRMFAEAFTSPYALRYGENPHQQALYYGNLNDVFEQLHGKSLSYNNLVDVDAAVKLIREFGEAEPLFAIIKHTNVCGIATRQTLKQSWDAALEGDPESAFGGVLVANKEIDESTAGAISELFFEVLIAPGFSEEAMKVLQAKKNRILLRLKANAIHAKQFKSVLNGVLTQDADAGNYNTWNEVGGRDTSETEQKDLIFGNLVCKHLKSNAIAIVKNRQLIGKGCGQTSRVDALRHAISKAEQFGFELKNSVLASDAFFPFDDCVRIAGEHGIVAFIQPGGSVRDADSINYCKANNLAMVLTGMRHFLH